MHPEEYRTREQEEEEAKEKQKASASQIFAGVLLTAKIIADRQPETVRQTLKKEWNNKVTSDITSNLIRSTYKDKFAPRQRNESRHEYAERRREQFAIRQKIAETVPVVMQDLTGLQGDQIFETTSSATTQEIAKRLLDENHATLTETERLAIVKEIAIAQDKHATEFKKHNDRNNERFIKKHSPEELQTLQQKEQTEAEAALLSRQQLKSELAPLEEAALSASKIENKQDRKRALAEVEAARNKVILENKINERVLSRLLGDPEVKNLDEDHLRALYRQELEKELNGKKGQRPASNTVSEDKIVQNSRFVFGRLRESPLYRQRTLPSPTPKAPRTTGTRPWFLSKYNFSFLQIDFRGLSQLLSNNSSGIGSSITGGLENLAKLFTKIPGLGSFFGGGAAASGGAAAAASAGSAAAAGAGAAAGSSILIPVLIIVAIILVVIFLLILVQNPTTQPYAVIEQQLTPTITAILTP